MASTIHAPINPVAARIRGDNVVEKMEACGAAERDGKAFRFLVAGGEFRMEVHTGT